MASQTMQVSGLRHASELMPLSHKIGGLRQKSESERMPASHKIFSALHLQEFSDDELRSRFDTVDVDHSGRIEFQEMVEVVRKAHEERVDGVGFTRPAECVSSLVFQRFGHVKDEGISFDEFRDGMRAMAAQTDRRMWHVAASMFASGALVGIVIPVMPVLVHQVGLSQAEFGYVVSAYGFSKLLANFPAGVVVDTRGRRASLVYGLGLVGLSMVGLGMAGSMEQMCAARLLTGAGAAFMMSGATLAVADMSTPLNRARMLGPVMTALSAGNVLGPAIGGGLMASAGLPETLYIVGGLFFLNAAATRAFIPETLPPTSAHAASGTTSSAAVRQTLAHWAPLWRIPDLRAALAVNAAFSAALAGGNTTLLPLLLSVQFGLTPAQIGTAFAVQGALTVACSGSASSLADRYGAHLLLPPGLLAMAASMATLPLAPDIWWAAVPIALNAVGQALLSSAPTVFAASLVHRDVRSHAISLMRTSGDIGWLVGGASIGILATFIGTGAAMQSAAAGLAVSACGLIARSLLTRRSA